MDEKKALELERPNLTAELAKAKAAATEAEAARAALQVLRRGCAAVALRCTSSCFDCVHVPAAAHSRI